MFDYRELLLKYLAHIIEVEGSAFISQTTVCQQVDRQYIAPVFSHDEVVELLNLETEARKIYTDI